MASAADLRIVGDVFLYRDAYQLTGVVCIQRLLEKAGFRRDGFQRRAVAYQLEDKLDRLGYDLERQPVLAAKSITLAVLAPGDYYRDFRLMNLVSAIDSGLAEFGRRNGLALGFEFNELGKGLEPDSKPEAFQASLFPAATA